MKKLQPLEQITTEGRTTQRHQIYWTMGAFLYSVNILILPAILLFGWRIWYLIPIVVLNIGNMFFIAIVTATESTKSESYREALKDYREKFAG